MEGAAEDTRNGPGGGEKAESGHRTHSSSCCEKAALWASPDGSDGLRQDGHACCRGAVVVREGQSHIQSP